MFYGYCYPKINGWHTPKVKLANAAEVISYCNLQSKFFAEIIITDELDNCVIHVQNRMFKVPQKDGTFKFYDIDTQTLVEGEL